MNKIRCAIYTRKSSEEGLEQDFNSLHAQREACAAYVMSQASEGWHLIPDEYDDGGISGGTLERPGLKRLLADIAAKKIDIVVVYKVDRLTRSLLDFSRLVEAFDHAEVSFVSVTQSFNTTTSMGRLTLNMLLSFAQFEREVTAERIRDKIAASKARGMWMGGVPPIGYRPEGRSLAIVDEHAAVIRHIFDRYLALGCVRAVTLEMLQDDIRVPARETATGRAIGGGSFSRGQIHRILTNPAYVGEIHHRGQVHAANHEPIIARETWYAVRQLLTGNSQGERPATHARNRSLLAGRLVDDGDAPLIATHACKGKVRYRYYVSRALQHDPDADPASGMRIPAREIEAAVCERVAEALDDPIALAAAAGFTLHANELRQTMGLGGGLAGRVRARDYGIVRDLVKQVHAAAGEIRIELAPDALARELKLDPAGARDQPMSLVAKVRLTRTGRAVRLVHTNGTAATAGTPDPGLIALLVLARKWWAQLATGEIDIATLSKREGVNDSWMSRVIRMNFLSPRIVDAILAGTQPVTLTAAWLRRHDLPLEWDAQADALVG
ncbi:recombinase family protein [Leptolyngbya sp. 15MV]|nr:recombinase family protein [Leptolyngbya sp. 15MV]